MEKMRKKLPLCLLHGGEPTNKRYAHLLIGSKLKRLNIEPL
jgi:hypothetical protein